MFLRGLRRPTNPLDVWAVHRHDPVPFVQYVLGGRPWEVQQQIMRSVADHRRVAVRSCHNSGKTWTAACLVLWWLFAYDPALVITTATNQRQVEKVLWPEIRRLHRKAGLPGRALLAQLDVTLDRRAFGFTTNTVENFQGWHDPNILIVADEASGIPEPIWEAIEGCLTSENARLLMIGNPNQAQGTFYDAFRSPLYRKFHISAFDVPTDLLPVEWAEEKLVLWGEESPAYQVRVLGQFPDQSEDSLISLSWVENAQQRESEPAGDYEMGVDVAESGGDESCVYLRHGSAVLAFKGWRNNDPLESAGQVIAFYNETIPDRPCRIKIDDIGLGAGTRAALIAHFKETPAKAVGLNVSEKAYDPVNYKNRRAEIFCGLRDHLKAGTISLPPEDNTLLSQLTALKYEYTAKGQVQLESKADLKKRRGTAGSWSSPDRADALALCFAHVKTPVIGAIPGPERDVGWRSRLG